MSATVRSIVLVLAWLPLASVVRAEVPVLRKQELEERATHIVTGRLTTIYRSVKRSAEYESTRGVAEVTVDRVEKGASEKGAGEKGASEKGAGVKAGQAVFVRFWNERWIGKGSPPPGSSGHHVPAEGTRVRAYVTQGEDGSFEMLLPNGMEELKAEARPTR